MILMKIVFQILVLYQIAQIISESRISKPLRTFLLEKSHGNVIIGLLHGLLSCFLCTSVWVGFLLTPMLFDFAEYIGYNQVSWFWNGLFFSSITWFLYVWEQSKT